MNEVAAATPRVAPLFLTDADVRAVFGWGGAIEVLRRAYTAPVNAAMFPPRGMAGATGYGCGRCRASIGWLVGGREADRRLDPQLLRVVPYSLVRSADGRARRLIDEIL